MSNDSINYLPDYLVIPCALIRDRRLQQLDHLVYGIIYWYSKMKMEKCIASNKAIAELLCASTGSVANSISRLHKLGFVRVLFDPLQKGKNKVRSEIIPLIVFIDPSSTDETPLHLQMKPPSSTDETPPSSTDEENINILEKEYLKSNAITQETHINGKRKTNNAPPNNRLFKPYSKMEYLQQLPQEEVQYFLARFPNLDEGIIRTEANRACYWLQDNDQIRRNYRQYLSNWLSKTAKNIGNVRQQRRFATADEIRQELGK